MKCSKVRDMLMAYISAELPPAEEADVRGHLADCVSCCAEFEHACAASDALALFAEEEAAPAILGAVKERLTRQEFGRRPALRPRLAMVSALLVAVLVAAGWFWQKSAVHENVPVAQQPNRVHTPAEDHRAAAPSNASGPVAQTPQAVPKAGMRKPAERTPSEKRCRAAPRPPVPKPIEAEAVPGQPAIAAETDELSPPETVAEAETDSEPVILFALRPAEPETYVIQISDQGESRATELIVVRKFDVGGNVTSVTIEHTTSSTSEPDSESPVPESSQLMDVSPAREFYAENLNSGGYVNHA